MKKTLAARLEQELARARQTVGIGAKWHVEANNVLVSTAIRC